MRVDAADETIDAGAGELFRFDPDERHSVTADGGARVLLTLAPWPGEGHYRGEESPGPALPLLSGRGRAARLAGHPAPVGEAVDART